jgi:hypothetical protein
MFSNQNTRYDTSFEPSAVPNKNTERKAQKQRDEEEDSFKLSSVICIEKCWKLKWFHLFY